MGWWIILAIVLVVLSYPFCRFLVKRLVLFVKLRGVCKKHGACFRGTHIGWLFARRDGRQYDLLITRGERQWAVKLFGTYRRASHLVFTSDGHYFVRHFLALFAYYQKLVMPFDGRRHALLEYRLPEDAENSAEPVKKVLLVHPICMEIRREREAIPLADGDQIRDMTILSLAALIRELSL